MRLARIDVDRKNSFGILQQQIKSVATTRADRNDNFTRLDLEGPPVGFRILPTHPEEQLGKFDLALFRGFHSGTIPRNPSRSSSTGPSLLNKGGSPIPCFCAICQIPSTRCGVI